MIVVDANLLIYATHREFPHHRRAHAWIERILSARTSVGFSWSVLNAFVRLSTRPGLFARPLTVAQAFDIVDGWLGCPVATIVHPSDRHAAILRELLERTGSAGNLVSDAELAAIAIAHGAELHSADGDFARFPGVRWRNPLDG